ncbi:Colicin I receptor precursor [compost metagenome]|uniref:TonB-dependent receptor n=2 Tax=Janthinobacterium lividum TaxID=29581 RepID=A0A377QEX5_9BURK|nr:TonB-dependent receptor [Janthinobacterium lividum]TNC74464.1 TonB-dependent receptor [Janthinobacterium lividum]STQ93954.1 Colicin I receptor precursor [Janthinobacterium lividum]
MAFKEKIGVRSVRLALTVLAGSVLFSGQSMADEAIQKVEITGSSIKRIAVEGALPVQRLSQEAIAKSGATSVADLIQALPAMQGFTIGAVAAGSDSGGNTSASLHGIGESYTLVLLNGRRIAPQGSGTTVNLNAIPMSAVERVEILTDGASALYGSDAIAGVLNFILKKNQQGATLEATYGGPEDKGGNAWNTSVTYGFGDLDEDRFNVLLSYRHDEQSKLRATDRDFAATSFVPFSRNGKNYTWDRTSTSGSPAGATVAYKSGATSTAFSPYLAQNGKCPDGFEVTTANARACGFDTGSTVEIVPQSKRDSLFSKATYKLNDNLNAFAELAYSRYDLTARIAANPIPIAIAKDSALYNTYVSPYLTPAQRADVKSVTANYRSTDFGLRASNTITETKHMVVGVEGELGAWNFESGLTWSQNSIDERYTGGYQKSQEFKNILANPDFNPFAATQKPSVQAQVAGAQFVGSVRTASTTMRGVDTHGSRELFSLPGGKASLGIGGDYRTYTYEQSPGSNATGDDIYNFNTKAAYDMSRDTYGAFVELLAPLTKSFEMTVGGRHDAVKAIDDKLNNKTVGKKDSANTYKVSARWQPVQTVLIRGSYGTGFKAPSMLEIAQPLVNAGFTAKKFDCPYPGNALCRAEATQYNAVSQGNPDLQSEKSKQFTLGFRVEPSAAFSFGADLWDVKLRNAVSEVSEEQAFADPVKYASSFGEYIEPSTGIAYYAFKKLSVNIGKKEYRGIDWDLSANHKFSFGKLTAQLSGTHMLHANYTKAGSDNIYTSNMNFFGDTNEVTFRNLMKLTTTLDTGRLSNTVTVNYRNGYTDAAATVYDVAAAKEVKGFRLQVPSYTTFDWQARFAFDKQTTIRAGIKNLFDRAPPLSLRASSGHQIGFDPRYADPMMRSFYVTGNYKF